MSINKEPILALRNIKAGYVVGERYIDAVSNVNLDVFPNEIFGIAGESGCGKSTLLKVIYGYIEMPLKIFRGSVTLNVGSEKIEINKLGIEDLKRKIWWRYITWIPQGSMNVLNPTMRIHDHFIEILKLYSNVNKKEAYKYTIEYLNSLGLPEEVAEAYPTQLSGGMRQRVVIAIALLLNPFVVLADEPTSALDVVTQKIILDHLLTMQRKKKFTLILVSHDMDVHGVLTDRIGIMYAGKIVEISPTIELFEKPLHPYSKTLIESLPRIGDKTIRTGISGSPPDLRNPPPGCRFHLRCPFAMDICRKEEPPMIEVKKNRFVACWLYTER
jgi:peptide/nickel transport system ATP-binding protein